MEETTALEINFSADVGTISSESFDTLKEWIDLNTVRYEGMEVTEENLPEVKKDLAEMRKVFDRLEEERKNIKRKWDAPYKVWETLYKNATAKLTGLIEDISVRQRALDDEIEKRRVEVVIALVTKDANDQRKGLGSVIRQNPALWNRVWKKEYGNKTASMNKNQLEWRQSIREVVKDLEIVETSAHVLQVMPVFLSTGSLAESMKAHQEFQKSMKAMDVKAVADEPPMDMFGALEPEPEPQPKKKPGVIEYVVAVAENPTEEDMRPAQGKRAFRGPMYKVKALLEFAEMLGLEMVKI